jgi:WD40 repeat protein
MNMPGKPFVAIGFAVIGPVIMAPAGDQKHQPLVVLVHRQEKEPLPRVLRAEDGFVTAVTFSPDGKTVAAGIIPGKKIFVWDTQTGKLLHQLETPQKNNNFNLAFSKDGRVLFSESRTDEMVRFWDVPNGKQIREVKRFGTRFLAFAPGGLVMATGGPRLSQNVNIVETETGKLIREIKQRNCVGAGFSPDGKTLATHDYEGGIKLWEVESAKHIGAIREKTKEQGAFTFVVFSPKGKYLAFGGHIEKKLRVWEREIAKEHCTLDSKGFFASASFSANEELLVAGSTDRLILYNLIMKKEIHLGKSPFPGRVAAFSADGSLLGVGGTKGDLYLYEMPGRQQTKKKTSSALSHKNFSSWRLP